MGRTCAEHTPRGRWSCGGSEDKDFHSKPGTVLGELVCRVTPETGVGAQGDLGLGHAHRGPTGATLLVLQVSRYKAGVLFGV